MSRAFRQDNRDAQQAEILHEILTDIHRVREHAANALAGIENVRDLLRQLDDKNQAGALFTLCLMMETGLLQAKQGCKTVTEGQARSASKRAKSK
jgi:hypothetical protein